MVSGKFIGANTVLSAREITRSFGATLANDRVSFDVSAGEIVGLVGENGAGKSTLLSIMAGFLRPDAGSLAMNGQQVAFSSSAAALEAGIGLVHQHLSLVTAFTVREQLRLAGWTRADLPEMLATDFHGAEVIENLPMGRRQRVEIARAMVGAPNVLLLDEPTTILAPAEVGALFDTIRTLSAQGTAIVIVTHKLREVMALADRVVVMAGGRVTGSFVREEAGWPEGIEGHILTRMFGPDREDRSGNGLPLKVVPQLNGTRPSGTPILRLDNVSTEARSGSRPLTGLGLSLWRGHIHAIVGVDGQGQRELAEVIAGYRTSTGTITLDGQDIQPLSAEARAERGIGMVVDDRLGEAAIGAMSVADNLMLKRPRPHSVAQRGILRRSGARRHARNLVAAWTIEPADDRSRFGTLSGGNMQRVLIAREIDRQPRVLVALNPVQGLDVHTAAFLWTRLRKLCDRGGAVVVFATDLDEALAESDRCAVMFDGRVSAMEPVSQVDRRAYGAMMVTGW